MGIEDQGAHYLPLQGSEWLSFPECLCKAIKRKPVFVLRAGNNTTNTAIHVSPFNPADACTVSPSWPRQNICLSQGTGTNGRRVSLPCVCFTSGCRNVTPEKWECVCLQQIMLVHLCPFLHLHTEPGTGTCSLCCYSTHIFSFLHQNKKSHWFLLSVLPLLAPTNKCHFCFLSIFDE